MTNFEPALIGCILLNSNEGIYACREHNISAESFDNACCRLAWEAVERLCASGKPVDMRTLEGEIGARTFEMSLSDMVDKASTIANVKYYAEEVKRAERSRRLAGELIVMQQDIRLGLGVDEALERLQTVVVELTDASKINIYKIKDLKDAKINQWQHAQTHGFIGIPFHLDAINEALGGARRKCVSIMAGYKGEGKSTLARGWAKHTALNGTGVALFTLEDPADIASANMVGDHANISVFGLDTGKCHESRITTMSATYDQIGDIPLYIISGSLTIDEICTTAALLKRKHNIGLVIIDHIQYVPPYILKGSTRNDTVAYYSARTTDLADKLDAHVCNLSQFARSADREQRKPRLSDLRDSGTLEQDARQAFILYFDKEKGHHMLEIAKNNYGQSGTEYNIKRVDGRQRFELIDGSIAIQPEDKYAEEQDDLGGIV